jgi:hypothetical protein
MIEGAWDSEAHSCQCCNNPKIRSEIENIDTQIKFCKTLAISTGVHGSETWVKEAGDKSRLQEMALRLLRSVGGLTGWDHVRNAAVRNKLEVRSLLDNIDGHRTNWLNHVQRLEANKLPTIITKYTPKGKRCLGIPRKRWGDQNVEQQQAYRRIA